MPDCLVTLGLLRQAEGSVLFTAVPPDIAAADLARPVERAIQQQNELLSQVHSSFLGPRQVYGRLQHEAAASIEVLTGRDVIGAALDATVDTCKEELLTAQPGGGRRQEILEAALPSELALLNRGAQQRTLYQHTVRTHAPTLAYTERICAAGAEVRTLGEVFDRLIIFDRKVAFITDPRKERATTALLVRHLGTVAYLVRIFEYAWERGEPLQQSASNHRPQLLTDETRLAVLRFMVDGHTDEVIGKRLGMSSRTVATHIKKTADLLGSRSRAQLAYLLVRSDLID